MVAGRLVTPSTTLPNLRTETIAEMCFDQPGERVLIGLVCLVGGWDIIVEHVDRQSDTVHKVRAGLVGPLLEAR